MDCGQVFADTLHLYGVGMIAVDPVGRVHLHAGLFRAVSQAEAVGKGLVVIRTICPPSKGYGQYTAQASKAGVVVDDPTQVLLE
jgi:hypothetical protein